MTSFLVRSHPVTADDTLYLDMVASNISLDGVVKEYVYYRVAYVRQKIENGVCVEKTREAEEYYPLDELATARAAFESRADEDPDRATSNGWSLEAIARKYRGNRRPGFVHTATSAPPGNIQPTEMPHYTRPPDYHPPASASDSHPKMSGGRLSQVRGRRNPS